MTYKSGAAEFLIVSLTAEPHYSHRYHETLTKLIPNTGGENLSGFDHDKVVDFWRAWSASNPAYAAVPWRQNCPRLVKATNAYTTTEPGLMLEFAVDADSIVRYALARNRNLSVPAFAILSEDTDEEIRRIVAKREDAPRDVLWNLAVDKSSLVRRWVAGNSSTPPDILSVLADSSDREVWLFLLQNPSLPRPLLVQLAEVADDEVQSKARKLIAMSDR